jgi:transcriptional regulator with XRE-family HTH domain
MDSVILLAMQDEEIRKAFGARLKELRKKKGWTQKALADKIGVQTPQLNKYEGGLHIPPAGKLIFLAEVFDTTVDFMLTGNASEEAPLHNLRLLERFRAREQFDAEDQDVVIKVIDALVVKRQVEGALNPFDKRSRRSAA